MLRWRLMCVVLAALLLTGCLGLGSTVTVDRRGEVEERFGELLAAEGFEALGMLATPITLSADMSLYGEEVAVADIYGSIGVTRSYTLEEVQHGMQWLGDPDHPFPGDQFDQILLGGMNGALTNTADDWRLMMATLAVGLDLVIDPDEFFNARSPVHSVNGSRAATVWEYDMEYQYSAVQQEAMAQIDHLWDGSAKLLLELGWIRSDGEWYMSTLDIGLHIQEEMPLRDLQGFALMLFGMLDLSELPQLPNNDINDINGDD